MLSIVQEPTCFEKTFVLEKERVLREHQVMGMGVLPGVVYLEMVVAATLALQGNFPVVVQNLTFTKPMIVAPGEPIRAELLLEPQTQVTKFKVTSRQENGKVELVEHATGLVATTHPVEVASLDLDTVRTRTSQVLQPKDIYGWYRNLGIEYGSGFQVIQSLHINDSQGLAVLEAPASWQEAAACYLHPALLDGALQAWGALLGLGTANQTDSLYLPFAIEKVTVYGQVQGRVFAHVRRSETEQKNSNMARGEVCIVSSDGRVLVELQGVTALRKPNTAQAPVSNKDLYKFCYQLLWQPEPAFVNLANEKRTWLVFMDEIGLAAALCQALQQAGHICINVKVSTEFSRIDKQNFSIAPGQASHFQQLWQAVYQDYPEISGVLYLWPLTNKDFHNTDLSQLQASVRQDLANLLGITQAITQHQQPLDLWLITNDSQPVTDNTQVSHPDRAALWGMVRVIAREYTQLRCHCVDLSLQEAIATLVEALCQEIQLASSSHDVAYRGGQRWTPQMVAIASSQNQPLPLHSQGVYLVTGGLGGLGGEVAKLLARADRPHLYLLGRKPLPPESAWTAWLAENPEHEETSVRIKQVQQLQSLGARVIPVSGDVANLAEMTALIQTICARHGKLHGIVHAAGVIQDGLLRHKSMSAIEEVLQPKVLGAWVLAQATQNLDLDFLVFFSSLAALTGNIGQGDYAAANAFLDAYAAYLRPSRPAFSINWGPWSNVGMLKAVADERIQAMGLEAIAPEEGQQLFDLALRQNSGQWVIFKQAPDRNLGSGTIPLNQLRPSQAPATTPIQLTKTQSSPELLKLIQSYLLTKIAQTLRLAEEHINPRENFMELGFDSIMAVQVKSSIEKDVNLTLDATLLFEFPSIIELAEYLANRHSEALTKFLLPDDPNPVNASVILNSQPQQPAPSNTTLKEQFDTQTAQLSQPLASRPTQEDTTRQQPDRNENTDIAIIGLSCRFPGAANPAQFWQNLQLGVDAITEVPVTRWDWQKFYHPDRSQRGKTCSKWGGFIEGIEEFDPAFFGLSWREALQMDPQQRLMLEVVWETLETAGYLPEHLSKVRTGVFIGAAGQEYVNVLKGAHRYHDAHTGSGNALSIISNRISYLFNWMGPSLTVDTACSSSLVALNLAYQALRRQEADVALVGGSNLILTPDGAIIFGQAGMLSADGHCKTFDSRADGYVRGEGFAAVLLKPLTKALRDKDNIWAVIKGAGVNHDGHSKASLTAPNPKAQRRLLEDVWQQAGIDPSHLSYIEAHGTGTSLGDPIEIRGLVEAFGSYTNKRGFCAIGTVKSNIGHLEPAAGIAGLLKVILALKHQQLPPILHFHSPNPHIIFEDSPFFVNDKLRQWTPGVDKRLAGVSSFGFGGANAHVVVQEAPTLQVERPLQDRPAHVFTLSAHSPEALQQLVQRYLEYLDQEDDTDIRDICFTVNTGRTHFQHRLAVVVRFKDQLADKLYIFSQTPEKMSRRSLIFSNTIAAEETVLTSLVARLQKLSSPAQAALKRWCQGSLFADKILPHLAVGADLTGNIGDVIYVELLTGLAQLYCLGVEVDWEAVDAGFVRKRVVLPTYAFQRQRCWLQPVTENTVSTNGKVEIHPLLGQPHSSLEGAVFEQHWHEQNSLLLQHHQVNNHAVLPGASAIEFMAAAAQYLQPHQTYRLSQIVFSRPLTLAASGEVWTQVLVQKNTHNLNFYLRSSQEEPSKQFHAWTDHAIAVLAEATFTNPAKLDIASIAARCPQLLAGEQIYQGFATAGLTYGSALQALTEVKVGQQEVLAELQLPDAWLATTLAYQVHPVLADAALQALAALVVQPERSQVLYIPFAIDEVRVYNRLPERILSWGRLNSVNNSLQENLIADVTLVTPEGEVLVEMKQVRLRRVMKQPESVSQAPIKNVAASLLHEQKWEASPIISTNQQQETQKPRLLLIDRDSIGTALAQSLRQSGIRVITAYPNSEFSTDNQDNYSLNPTQPQHWQQLATLIQQQQIQEIIHLWTATTPPDTHNLLNLEQGLNQGLKSLFSLTQALVAQQYLPKGLRLRLITANSQAPSLVSAPERAATWGLLKTIALEIPQLQTQAIEIQLDTQTNLHQLVEQLHQEITSPISQTQIAYNQGQRWHKVLKPIPNSALTTSSWQVQPQGVYLITGGLGGIGLEVATWLAQQCQVQLILTTRSSFPAPQQWSQWLQTHPTDDSTSIKIRHLQTIISLGSRVWVEQVDVGDFVAMSGLFSRIYAQHSLLQAIFHAAGVTKDGLLRSKSQQTLSEVLQPKVYGSWFLHSLSLNQKQSPPLMVLFSSVAAITGNVGQGDYAAANCYLDSFAQWRQAQGLPTVSMNWGLWAEVGMGKQLAQAARARGLAPLSTSVALAAFKEALNLLPSHPVVAVLNQNPLQSGEPAQTAAHDSEVTTPAVEVKPEPPTQIATTSNLSPRLLRQQIQEQVINVMATVLETQPERIDPQQSFLEMGLDSILAVRAVKEIQERTQSSFPATLLFDYPNVEALAAYLSEQPNAGLWGQNQNEPLTPAQPAPITVENGTQPISSAPEPLPPLGVPIVDNLGMQVIKQTPLGLSVILPAKPENLNHIGTIYAGALFALGESVAAIALMRAISRDDINFVVLGVRITYQEMAINEVQCDVYLEAAQISLLLEKLHREGEVRYTCPVPIQDKWGKLVCQLEVDFLLRGKSPSKMAASLPQQVTTQNPLTVNLQEMLAASVASTNGKTAEQTLSVGQLKPEGQMTEIADTDMAIIGYSGRFPNAQNLDEYWHNLANGINCIQEIPSQRWALTEYFDPDPQAPGKMYTKWGGFMKSIDEFDPLFFGISPREAEAMDPQQRLILETAWEAMEMAGYAKDTVGGSSTGVFIGVSSAEYARTQLHSSEQVTAAVGLGNSLSIVANRISYQFNLKGPSLVVDTACSSSLVALNIAVRSILQGECETALIGGVYVILAPESYIFFSKGRFMSPVGQCKTFDANADGYVRGEGAGVLMIKPLKKALRDRDTIHAVIKSVAINQDGKSNGLTAPNSRSQVAVLKNAYKQANVNPDTISYIEAHGTGTDLGDPIEVNALTEVFREYTQRRQFCAIGSVKTNIGHLEPAAGMASLIKVILALKHQQIPPTLNFATPNPYITFEDTPFYVNTNLRYWQPVQGVRRAGISSFGFGGTNTHVILEEAPTTLSSDNIVERPVHILTLSARSQNSRRELAQQYISYLEKNPDTKLSDLCFSANCGRSHFIHRLAITANSVQDLQAKLTAFVSDKPTTGIEIDSWESRKRPPLVFLFTGQGSQKIQMARELYETQPVFRQTLDRCAVILQPYLQQSLLSVIYPEVGKESVLNETKYTQPALFAIEYALATLWRSYGVEPDAVLGHSVGEYAAACVAGVFSLEDGLRLIARRGQLMQSLPQTGGMAAVFADEATVSKFLQPFSMQLAIAAVNGSQNTVIAGESQALEAVLQSLEQQGIDSHTLAVSHAFHSPLMEPILDEFYEFAQTITYHPPQIPLVSNLTGRFLERTQAIDASYWRNHIRKPVLFASGIQSLASQGFRVFLEVGPHPILNNMARQIIPGDTAVWLHSLERGKSDWQTILNSLARLYTLGTPVDWEGFDKDYIRQRIALPTYPFNRKRYWLNTEDSDRSMSSAPKKVEIPSIPLNSFVEILEE
ncbi:type I polyketide synthase [Chlorogloeopsis fritschii]|uniref:type I polyketide synthase n=1 Tax=Chlorogloeopsis fritschii TaxID=1124 RepID=UPI0023F4121F|nr:type I polyketide synthase [Chlorogloeopsis fritschii]